MNKQIEEMMEVVHDAEVDYFHTMVTGDIDDIIDGVASRDEIVATALYNAGYRKASVGKWVDVYNGKYANQLYKCSVCGESAYGNGKVWFLSKFCPSCGADMRGEVR